jgi:phosphoglycolate phosphatase
MYRSTDHLIIFDADGTLIDAFSAIDIAFAHHSMDIGDLERFQKRRNLFKYIGGIKEFPRNLAKQMGKRVRKELLVTLTEGYQEEALLYLGMAELIRDLIEAPGIRVGMVTRNICHEPKITLARLFAKHDIEIGHLNFMHYLPLREEKSLYFKAAREQLDIDPAPAFACGDEHGDYAAALVAGIHPLIVSYGFESHARLAIKSGSRKKSSRKTRKLLAIKYDMRWICHLKPGKDYDNPGFRKSLL